MTDNQANYYTSLHVFVSVCVGGLKSELTVLNSRVKLVSSIPSFSGTFIA
jgi:hypothetical protein